MTRLPHAAMLGALAFLAACAPVEKKPAAPTSKAVSTETTVEDPYLWLEDIHGEKPLEWVHAENAKTAKAYADTPAFEKTRERILEVLDSEARIPYVQKLGAHYYNFWKDATHPLGIWRRTTLAEYRKANPHWELVLDLDALSKNEGKRWVWHGASCLKPEYRRCLLALSPGGGDANVVREFDLVAKAFVDGGFEVAEAKSEVDWIDRDRIYVMTDFGPGSMTKSSYPRIAKEWTRGTPIENATTVFEVKEDDLGVGASHDRTPGFERDFVTRVIDFWNSETWLRGKGGLAKIDVPLDAIVDAHREWLLIQLRSDWSVGGKTYKGGSLVAAKFDEFMAGKRELVVLFEPTETVSLGKYSWTRHHLLLDLLDNVASRQEVLTPRAHGAWKREPLGGAPALSTVDADGIDADASDDYFMAVTSYLAPTTLYYGTLGKGKAKPIKRTPAFFDAKDLDVHQYFVASKDGTRIPYFVVAKKTLVLDGSNPTLLYGYGGFEVSEVPAYSGTVGRSWLERGGVYVVANIRGGGEFGEEWHKAGNLTKKQTVFDDFAAAAQYLIEKKYTRPEKLALMGGSNGGLLMGALITQHPDLMRAVVSSVGIYDMLRVELAPNGAFNVTEFGTVKDPEQFKALYAYSPYHHVTDGSKYPAVLMMTGANDGRVAPYHSRKMTARLQEANKSTHPILLRTSSSAGHGIGTALSERIKQLADIYSFLFAQLDMKPVAKQSPE